MQQAHGCLIHLYVEAQVDPSWQGRVATPKHES